MKTVEFNQVSLCCNREIGQVSRIEYPTGGRFGITYKREVCTCCGNECEAVDECGVCGTVGCNGDCDIIQAEEERLRIAGIVDISEQKDESQ